MTNINQFYPGHTYIFLIEIYMYKYLAEFLGTLFLVYIVIATQNPLAIGAALALAILMTATISGGYINPAVTISMAAAGKLDVSEIIPYVLAQIFGGLVAIQIYLRYKV